jgi:hypothetical protein
MACIIDERIVAQEMGNGRLLLATPMPAGESWGADRLRFLDPRTLRWYGTRRGGRLQGGQGELRVVDFDLGTGRIVREIRLPGKDNVIRGISPDGQSVLLKSRTLEPTREKISVVDLRTGEPPVDILMQGVQSGLSFLPDGRVVIARRDQDRIELRILNGRGAELKRFHLPGRRVRLGGQPAPGLLALVTTRDPSEKTWRSDLLDLESGALRPIGEGMFPQAWPGLPPGSVGTQLFVQKKGGLVRIDPITGRQRAILHPES